MLKGTSGRGAAGGTVPNEILYSRLELPVLVFPWAMSFFTLLSDANNFSWRQGSKSVIFDKCRVSEENPSRSSKINQ